MVFKKILIWTIVLSFAFANATYANPTPSLTEGNIVATAGPAQFTYSTPNCVQGAAFLGVFGIVLAGTCGSTNPLFILSVPIGCCAGGCLANSFQHEPPYCCQYNHECELNLSYPAAGPVQERMTEKDDSCQICLERFSTSTEGNNQTNRTIVVITPCKHKICERCFKNILKGKFKAKCPLCEKEIRAGDQVILFQAVSAHNTPPPAYTPSEAAADPSAPAPSNEDNSVGSNTPAPDYSQSDTHSISIQP